MEWCCLSFWSRAQSGSALPLSTSRNATLPSRQLHQSIGETNHSISIPSTTAYNTFPSQSAPLARPPSILDRARFPTPPSKNPLHKDSTSYLDSALAMVQAKSSAPPADVEMKDDAPATEKAADSTSETKVEEDPVTAAINGSLRAPSFADRPSRCIIKL